jgi:hypothetical protein
VYRRQDLYLSGDERGAIAAIPTSLVEGTVLIGPIAKIRDGLAAWKETLATTLRRPAAFLGMAANVLR